jgi:aspartyl-tRNA(Asn)/glutamyl-tRNA(Gln) amidotransferase subunit A
MPNGQSQAGLPIGVQLVGRHFEEVTILRAAAAFETRVRFVAPPL